LRFLAEKIDFLGHSIGEKLIQPMGKYKKTILDYMSPERLKNEIFLGLGIHKRK
jgi:hypothetical protein